MKTFTFAISVALLALAGSNASAQRYYDTRVDVPRIVNPDRAVYDRGYRGDWDLRVRGDLERLNRDVARMRAEIGDSRDRGIRARFHDIRRATDRLNYAFNRRAIRGWEVRRRIDAIEAELDVLRGAMRGRYERRGWR